MINEIQFRFDELNISKAGIIGTLGYKDELPEPFSSYLNEVIDLATKLQDIRAAYSIFDTFEMRESSGELIVLNSHFHIGKTLIKEIRNSSRMVLYICSAGATISNKAKELMAGDDSLLGYIYDVVGSYIAEAAGDKMQRIILSEICLDDEKITNRYSPGYVKWSVQEQHELFLLFNDRTAGVNLTSSALMVPAKSISGLFGIGTNVKFRKNLCELCTSKNCTFRKTKAGITDGCSRPI
jgi:hypothetical protein